MSNQLGNSNKGIEYIKQLTTFEFKSEISEIKNLLHELNKRFIIIEESMNSKILN